MNEAGIFGFVQPQARPVAVALVLVSTHDRHFAGVGVFDSCVKILKAVFEKRAAWHIVMDSSRLGTAPFFLGGRHRKRQQPLSHPIPPDMARFVNWH